MAGVADLLLVGRRAVAGEVPPAKQSPEGNDAAHRAHQFSFSGGARIVMRALCGTRFRRAHLGFVICATYAPAGFMGLSSI